MTVSQISEYQLPSDTYFQALQQIAKAVANETTDLIDLAMINADLEPPRYSIDKLAEASIKPENHHYAVARGIRRLRESFAGRYKKYFDITLSAESEVCVTQGAKDGIIQSLHVLAGGAKKKIIIPTPYYPAHATSAAIAGFTMEFIPLLEDEQANVQMLSEAFRQGDAAACLMSFPSNPTGAVVSKQFWQQLGKSAAEHGVVLVNDFVYGELTFNESGRACSALVAREQGATVVETYSLSKAFSVAGWRVGCLAGSPEIIHAVAQRKSFTGFGIFLPLQIAAAATLSAQQDLIATTRETYETRTRFLSSGLRALGWQVRAPRAGICVWAQPPFNAGNYKDSYELSREILTQTNIFVTPGDYFGSDEKYVRFACVKPQTKLQAVLDALRQLKV